MRDQIDGMLKSGVIEKTTHAKYRSEARLILRFMKDVQVSKVTGAMVRKMDQEMLAAGYARETVARVHNALKRHLYSAQEKGYIASMPITRSNRPPRLERKEANGLDEQTRRRLLGIIDEMPDTPFTLAIRLGLGAGLRNEEAIGLKWDLVDLERGVIRIRNVISMAGGTPIEKGPKDRSQKKGHSHRSRSHQKASAKSQERLWVGGHLEPAGPLRTRVGRRDVPPTR